MWAVQVIAMFAYVGSIVTGVVIGLFFAWLFLLLLDRFVEWRIKRTMEKRRRRMAREDVGGHGRR